MNVMIAGVTSIIFYLAGSAGQWLRLRGEGVPAQRIINALIVLGLIAHTFSVYLLLDRPGGINLNIFTVGALAVWAVILLTLIAGIRQPIHNLYLLILPMAVIVLLAAILIHGPQDIFLPSGPLIFHILSSVVAYSLLTIAACQALLIAYQDHQLKARHPRTLLRVFPPLQTMERLLFTLVWAGLILLSISLASGFYILEDMFAQHVAHRTILSIFAWFIFAILLWGRHHLGWRGQTAIRWTLAGFLLLMMAYFGSKLILDLLH